MAWSPQRRSKQSGVRAPASRSREEVRGRCDSPRRIVRSAMPVAWARLLERALVVCATAYLAVAVALGPAWTVDDAYIVARYAENLVRHGELAWNPGEPRVEGFTGFALPLVVAAGISLGADPIAVATAVGIASLAAGAVLFWLCLRELALPAPAAGLAYAGYVAAAEHTTHALSGLETELFAAVVLACARAFLRLPAGPDPGVRPTVTLALLGAACAVVRPEGVVVGAAFLVAAVAVSGARGRALAPWASRAVTGLAAPLAAMQLARLAHYGDWLPNTFHAKRDVDGLDIEFLRSAMRLLETHALAPLVLAAGCAAAAKLVGVAPLRPIAPRARALVACSLAIAATVAAVYSGRDLVMNYSSRFAFHVFPLVALALAVLTGLAWHAIAALRARAPALGRAFVLVALAVLAVPIVDGVKKLDDERVFRREYRRTLETQHLRIARWLRASFGSGATVACYPDAGVVPYVSKLRAIDFGRLSDRTLAREARSPREVADYFFRSDPDVLVLTFLARGKPFDEGASEILRDPRFSRYVLHADYGANGVGPSVYVKR